MAMKVQHEVHHDTDVGQDEPRNLQKELFSSTTCNSQRIVNVISGKKSTFRMLNKSIEYLHLDMFNNLFKQLNHHWIYRLINVLANCLLIGSLNR